MASQYESAPLHGRTWLLETSPITLRDILLSAYLSAASEFLPACAT